jgi:hypothetical protein
VNISGVLKLLQSPLSQQKVGLSGVFRSFATFAVTATHESTNSTDGALPGKEAKPAQDLFQEALPINTTHFS